MSGAVGGASLPSKSAKMITKEQMAMGAKCCIASKGKGPQCGFLCCPPKDGVRFGLDTPVPAAVLNAGITEYEYTSLGLVLDAILQKYGSPPPPCPILLLLVAKFGGCAHSLDEQHGRKDHDAATRAGHLESHPSNNDDNDNDHGEYSRP